MDKYEGGRVRMVMICRHPLHTLAWAVILGLCNREATECEYIYQGLGMHASTADDSMLEGDGEAIAYAREGTGLD